MSTFCSIYDFHSFLISWMSIIFKYGVSCFHSGKGCTYLQNSGINLVLPLAWLPQLALRFHHHTDFWEGYSSWVGQLFTAPGWACSFITTSFDYTLLLQAFIFSWAGMGLFLFLCAMRKWSLLQSEQHILPPGQQDTGSTGFQISCHRGRLKKSLHPQLCDVVSSCFLRHRWALPGWLPVQMSVRRQSVCLSPVGLLFTHSCSTRIYKSLE